MDAGRGETSALSRQYAKLCDRRDFEDPALLAAIRELLPEREPLAHIERKVWEFGMAMLFLAEAELLHDGTRALSVGAGNERILFWLANRVGEIVATDTYGEGAFADIEAGASMLSDPSAHAPFPYREDRLTVARMDARDLDCASESFDLVLTLSSIEHFGSRSEIATAAAEIGRVLKPGGYAVIVTDCFVRLALIDVLPVWFGIRAVTGSRRSRLATPRRRSALAQVFTPAELDRIIVGPSRLRTLQPLRTGVSAETWDNPRLLIQRGRSAFTSVCLVLAKP
jgi:SAM-dependent methyltransferase